MEVTKCLGKVLQNGQVSIPLDLFAELGLTVGEEIEVTLRKVNVKKNTKRKKTAEVALLTVSESAQKRMRELLFKNREGQISPIELLELEKLVFETQIKTLEKAKDLYEQKKKNIGAMIF
jgi:bifunctional DNA-binding transcriptional regulator/antitoxin component of YhaV-PrlF toxin-antitoxin module